MMPRIADVALAALLESGPSEARDLGQGASRYDREGALLVVQSGRVVRSLGLPPDEVTLDLMGPGQGVMLSASSTVRAVEPSVLLRFDGRALEQLWSRLPLYVIEVLNDACARLDALTVARGQRDATEQIYTLLQMLADEHGVCPNMRRSDVSALLAMRVETTSRALRVLREAGRVQWPWPGVARVL